jgi:hypothetical protein
MTPFQTLMEASRATALLAMAAVMMAAAAAAVMMVVVVVVAWKVVAWTCHVPFLGGVLMWTKTPAT